MNFKIKKNMLQEKLNVVAKAISSKNIIPILSGIKFELNKDKLILTASDNNITIETSINVDDKNLIVKTLGTIIIKGKYIIDIVRKLESEFINIEVIDGNKILIYNDNSEFNLNGINSKEFPVIDLELTGNPLIIKKDILKKAIIQTNYATSIDESRIILTGINFKISNNLLELSATDSYRLAYKKIKLDNNVENDVNLVIPSRNLLELLKLLDDNNNEIKIHLFNNKIIFDFDDIVFQTRIINGNYPNTNNLISETASFEILINKMDFFGIVDRASILNNDKDNNIITLEINDKNLRVTSNSLEVGKVEENYSINCNDNIKISFNSKYMLEALKTFDSENVRILFIGEVRPILIKEEKDDNLLQLILPIRTY